MPGKGNGYTECPTNCQKSHSRFYIVGCAFDVNTFLRIHGGRFDGIAYYKVLGLFDMYHVIVEYKHSTRPRHDNKQLSYCATFPLLGLWSYIIKNAFMKGELQKMTHVYGFRTFRTCNVAPFSDTCWYFQNIDLFEKNNIVLP